MASVSLRNECLTSAAFWVAGSYRTVFQMKCFTILKKICYRASQLTLFFLLFHNHLTILALGQHFSSWLSKRFHLPRKLQSGCADVGGWQGFLLPHPAPRGCSHITAAALSNVPHPQRASLASCHCWSITSWPLQHHSEDRGECWLVGFVWGLSEATCSTKQMGTAASWPCLLAGARSHTGTPPMGLGWRVCDTII